MFFLTADPVTGSAPDDAAGFTAWIRPHWQVMAGLAAG